MYLGEKEVARLVAKLQTFVTDEHVFPLGLANTTENMVHEIAHALSLGIRPTEQIKSNIFNTLVTYRDAGTGNECLTLACEATTLPRLGIPVDLNALLDAGVTQGVDRDRLRRAIGSKRARKLAVMVLRYIGRQVGMRSSIRAGAKP